MISSYGFIMALNPGVCQDCSWWEMNDFNMSASFQNGPSSWTMSISVVLSLIMKEYESVTLFQLCGVFYIMV
jgi:hypothetical protein